MSLPRLLDRPSVLYGVAVLGTAVVGLLDQVSGSELSFSIFYLLPVGLVALKRRARAAILFALASGVVWAAIDISSNDYSHWAIGCWNALVRFGFFVIVAVTLSRLQKHIARESSLASTDPLTGVANSRAFYSVLEREIKRMARTGKPLVLAYLDLDNFKQVNDENGHLAGDQVLRACAATLTKHVRAIDSVSRLGGDEFAVLFPETGLEDAKNLLERVRKELLKDVPHHPRPLPVTFSIGVVVAISAPEQVEDLVRAADGLMYEVKKSGKNNLAIEIFQAREGGT